MWDTSFFWVTIVLGERQLTKNSKRAASLNLNYSYFIFEEFLPREEKCRHTHCSFSLNESKRESDIAK